MFDKAEVAERFHRAVSVRIDPTFDVLARVCDRHPVLYPPIVAGLVAVFPAWLALAQVVNAARRSV